MSLVADVSVRRGAFLLQAVVRCGDGETVAVLGPNGAGKSTLLRALAGLEPISAGQIAVGGRVLEDVATGVRIPAEQRRTGVLFQDYRLFPHLSAADNVAFGLRAAGVHRPQARRAAEELLGRLGLHGLADRRPRELSGGQAQRVALARALAGRPCCLLLDEPLSALDAEVRSDVRRLLRTVLTGFAGPSVLVTHDPLEALTLADRMVVLEHGRVVQEGVPAQVAGRPATAYVATLVGLNLYRGALHDGLLQVDGGGEIACASGDLRGVVHVTVRPSAVTVYATEPVGASARNLWRGRITSVEAAGERVRLTVASTPPVVAEVTARALAELRIGSGDDVWVAVKATDVAVQT
jgi:molybdate transport system ATP-binding protein